MKAGIVCDDSRPVNFLALLQNERDSRFIRNGKGQNVKKNSYLILSNK